MTQATKDIWKDTSDIRVPEATAQCFRLWRNLHNLRNETYILIDEQKTLPVEDANEITGAFDNLSDLLLKFMSRTIEEVNSHTSCPDDLM